MANRLNKFIKDVRAEMRENRSTFVVYALLRILVLIVMVMQFFNGNFENVFLCLLTLVLMIMPSIVQTTLKVEFPSVMEIIILFFIFAAEILGEISAFYQRFQYWDAILHVINGFICAGIGFSLVDIINRQKRYTFSLSPLYLSIVAFCFSMTIGVLWEFLEFGVDRAIDYDMQKDTIVSEVHSTLLDPTQSNDRVHITDIKQVTVDGVELEVEGYLDLGLIDTMYDMLVNFIGAVTFSILGFFYVKRRDKGSILSQLVPEPWSAEKEADRKENA